MPVRKLSADQKILLAGLAIAIILSIVAAVIGTAEQVESAVPSSYASGRGGAKAAYVLLDELHYRVQRWTASPTDLATVQEPATLILAEPTLAASPEEKEALKAFLERGGRVLAVGDRAAGMLGNTRAHFGVQGMEWKTFPRVLPTALTRNAPKIAMAPSSFWQASSSQDLVHYSADGEDVVVSYPVGNGEVIWWAGATPLTNNGISEYDNVALFLNSVGAPGDRRVLWDEYFHEGGHTVMESVIASPIKWAFVQLAVLGMLVLFTYSRRHGPIFVPTPAARLSPLEFVDALAQLYHRAHATNVSLEVAYNRFRSEAAPRVGLPRNCTARQLAAAYQEKFGKQEPDLGPMLARAESLIFDHTVSEPETIELVRQLHRLTMAMRPQRKRKPENK